MILDLLLRAYEEKIYKIKTNEEILELSFINFY